MTMPALLASLTTYLAIHRRLPDYPITRLPDSPMFSMNSPHHGRAARLRPRLRGGGAFAAARGGGGWRGLPRFSAGAPFHRTAWRARCAGLSGHGRIDDTRARRVRAGAVDAARLIRTARAGPAAAG